MSKEKIEGVSETISFILSTLSFISLIILIWIDWRWAMKIVCTLYLARLLYSRIKNIIGFDIDEMIKNLEAKLPKK